MARQKRQAHRFVALQDYMTQKGQKGGGGGTSHSEARKSSSDQVEQAYLHVVDTALLCDLDFWN